MTRNRRAAPGRTAVGYFMPFSECRRRQPRGPGAAAEAAALAAEKEQLLKENAALKGELAGAAAENEAIVKNLMHTPACVFFEIGQAILSVK